MVTSKRVYAKGDLPSLLLPVPCPCGKLRLTHTSTGYTPTLVGISFQCPEGSLVLSSETWCMQDFVCALQDWSLIPPVLWKSNNQIPLGFKVRFPGDSQSLCQTPRLGSLTWGSEPSQQWKNFFGIIVFQFVGHPPGGYRIWFYCDCVPPTILLRLLCLWKWGNLFW